MEVFELSYSGSPKGLMDYIGEAICEYCHGTGEVSVMEAVYPGEAPQAPIGTMTCSCRLSEPGADDIDDDS